MQKKETKLNKGIGMTLKPINLTIEQFYTYELQQLACIWFKSGNV